MAVTDFVDDESPLYVAATSQFDITGFHDKITEAPNSTLGESYFISGGIYTLSPKALTTLSRCMEEGQHRLRNFQRGLIADGLKLKAHLFDKILDIDHASDIAKAESFLQEGI